MPTNPPNGYQKPINKWSFQREGVLKNYPENYLEEFSAQRSSPALKKLCCKHYKVIEVPWGATPVGFPSPFIRHGLDVAF